MGHQGELVKHFEAIVGRELIDLDEGVVILRDYTAHYDLSDGFRTSRQIGTTGNSSKACSNIRLLDVGGIARTRADGKLEFLLSDFFCRDFGTTVIVNFLATPLSEEPVFVTAKRQVTSNDVKITVHSWDVNGRPAPNIVFDWRCRVPYLASVD
jgi:hypothetical protein